MAPLMAILPGTLALLALAAVPRTLAFSAPLPLKLSMTGTQRLAIPAPCAAGPCPAASFCAVSLSARRCSALLSIPQLHKAESCPDTPHDP